MTVAANGDTQLTTAAPFDGLASIAFDGSGDYAQSAVYSPTPSTGVAGEFCQECWFWVNDSGVTRDIMGMTQAGAPDVNWIVYRKGSSDKLCLFVGNSSSGFDRIIGTDTVIAGQWNHAAHTRNGTSQKLWLNGVLQGEHALASADAQGWNTDISLKTFILGSYMGTAEFFAGKIDNYRLTFGIARYTAPFTPPVTLPGA